MQTSLNLRNLSKNFRPGLTSTAGTSMAEAAAVCLDSQNHKEKAILSVTGTFNNTYSLTFKSVTVQMKNTHADLEVATEYGAYGIAILLIEANVDLTVVERSRKGTGFDYWLGTKSDCGPYFQNKPGLEVSGIRNGTDRNIETRLKEKNKQVTRSDGSLPIYIAIIEFSAPQAKVITK